MDKKRWTILYIILNILIVILIGVIDPEIKNIKGIFPQMKVGWAICALLSMVLFWLTDGVILNFAVENIYERKNIWDCMKVALIGQYYNAVTPFASGGQPAQVYYMNKFGVPGGSASSILAVKFLVYQVILSIFCLMAFILKGLHIYKQNSWLFWFSVLGFIINSGAIILMLALSSNKGFIKKVAFFLIKLLNKIRIIKDVEESKEKLESHIEDFQTGLILSRDNPKIVFKMSLMTIIQLVFYFSITFFIYRSLGLVEEHWANIVAIQSLLYLSVCFIPTPGSTGASETGFMIFFRLLFPSHLIFVAMLIWRIISYYLNIIVGAIIILFDGVKSITSQNIAN